MPNLRMRILLFLSSYFPLFVIVSIILYFDKENLWAALLCLTIGLLCLLGALSYLSWCRRHLQRSFAKVKDYQRRDGEALSYVATYIVPFATFNLDVVPQILALSVFIAMMLILYVNSNLIYVNPMLNLFRYHLYEVNLENSGDHSHYYIARKRLRRGDTIHYVTISDEVILSE
jgi:hypothetical protein